MMKNNIEKRNNASRFKLVEITVFSLSLSLFSVLPRRLDHHLFIWRNHQMNEMEKTSLLYVEKISFSFVVVINSNFTRMTEEIWRFFLYLRFFAWVLFIVWKGGVVVSFRIQSLPTSLPWFLLRRWNPYVCISRLCCVVTQLFLMRWCKKTKTKKTRPKKKKKKDTRSFTNHAHVVKDKMKEKERIIILS